MINKLDCVLPYVTHPLEMRINIRDITNESARLMKEDKDVMIANLPCCTPEHTVQEAAEMMARHVCGEIAIVENAESLKPVGVITDRDITWRVVAMGKSPTETSVRDAMLSLL